MNKALRKLLWGVSLLPLHLAGLANAEESIAVMRVLDKITTRVSEVHAPTGVAVAFGSLRFTVRACHQSAPEDPPESKVFLEIWEEFSGENSMEVPKNFLFSSWMFASSPASSALEHPVYDIWPLRCEAVKSSAPELDEAEGESAEPENTDV